MTDLTTLSMSEAREGLDKGEFSAVELTKAHIDSLEKHKRLNAFVTETPDLALKQAEQSDQRIKSGDAGLLEGLPIGMKDMFCTEGVKTTAASKMLQDFVPPYESTVSGKLKDAGTIMLGKTNQDEFAMGGSNATSYFGPCYNPWKDSDGNDKLVPGGSSGGSAAAVAADMCLGATGTDTGGSIRQPASYCGIVGLKPTYGRCSRYGIVAFASSLDQAGCFNKTVEDAALMIQAMSGFDPKDSTSAPIEVPDFASMITKDVKGMKIGIPKEYRSDNMSDEIVALWEQGAQWLKEAGAEVVDISLPHTQYALPTYYIVAPAEASSNLSRYDGVRYTTRVEGESLDDLYCNTRADGFGAEVRRRIMIGTYVLSAGYYDAYYLKAQKVRSLIAQDFTQAFEKVDAILTPTAPTPAFEVDDPAMKDPVNMYLNDIFTVPTSLAGLPGLSVPVGLSDKGTPLGLQLIGKAFDEGTILNVGSVLEEAANFKTLAGGAA